MTNGEKYKTAKERAEAIQKYCAQHHDCDGCPFVDLMGDHCSVCQFYWLDLEAPAEKDPIERICALHCFAVEHRLDRKPIKLEIHASPDFMHQLEHAKIRYTPLFRNLCELPAAPIQQQIFGMPLTVVEGLKHDFEIVAILTEAEVEKSRGEI